MAYKFDITEEKDRTRSTPLGNFETPEDAIKFLNEEKFAKNRMKIWFDSGSALLEKRQISDPKNSKPITTHFVEINNKSTPRSAKLGSEIIEENKS